MVEVTVLWLRMLMKVIIFGLLAGVTAIIWEEVGSFVCGLVETVKVREPSEDIVDGEEVDDFEGGLVETVKVREPSEDVVDGEDDPNCVLATDEDFSDTDNGEFRHIEGVGKWLILGVLIGFIMFRLFAGVTAIFGGKVDDFEGGLVETVKVREPSEDVVAGEDDPNDMSYMFNSIQDTELDLSNFNTSNVTDLSYMFLEVKSQS